MDEYYLHYLWQYQYFDKTNLTTTRGDQLVILKTGFPHQDAGPDFQEAKVQIATITWHGKIEIHVKASDWMLHRHNEDQAYDNVILHVVWHDDQEIFRRDGSYVPVLELKSRVNQQMFRNYRQLVGGVEQIPCAGWLKGIPAVNFRQMLDRALVERMEVKMQRVLDLLKETRGDWHESSYRLLARNFGFRINSDSFELLTRYIPYRLVQKHYLQPHQLEAIFFGTGGFLEDGFTDPYGVMLRQEYAFLARKYMLPGRPMIKSQWKFLRLRPANFPTIRISQLANLLAFQPKFFSIIRDEPDLEAIIRLFLVNQSDYWKSHYLFDKPASGKINAMGRNGAETLVTNTVVPLLLAYARYSDQQFYFEKAMQLLEKMGGEKNKILNLWKKCDIQSRNAFESQGLLGLFHLYCSPKRCLSCGVGLSVINGN